MATRRFTVTVDQARDLYVRDRSYTADPYAVVNVPWNGAAMRYRTKPAHKTLDPKWTGTMEVFALFLSLTPLLITLTNTWKHAHCWTWICDKTERCRGRRGTLLWRF